MSALITYERIYERYEEKYERARILRAIFHARVFFACMCGYKRI
jgi:hypothetical protein